MSLSGNHQYWNAILYEDNMVDDWQTKIYDTLQIPFAYARHDEHDVDDDGVPKKQHLHLILAFPNTTTRKHAFEVANLLSKNFLYDPRGKLLEGCCSTIQASISVKGSYDYLTHNTEGAIKQGKYLYPSDIIVEGNGFDLAQYVVINDRDKRLARIEISNYIIERKVLYYSDVYSYVLSLDDEVYESVLVGCSGHFDRLCRSNYYKIKKET